jgi:hypothetical protein
MADQGDMKQMHEALENGEGVEIDGPSPTSSTSGKAASEAVWMARAGNEREARIVDANGVRVLEVGVNEEQALSLIEAGAIDLEAEAMDCMNRLRGALKAGRHVEVERHIAHRSENIAVLIDNTRRAAEANAKGDHVARIRRKNGMRQFECGVNREEARELLSMGAVFIGPMSQHP